VRLLHFSEDAEIAVFEPRPVRVPSARPPGQDWLNGPLVWAIEEARRALYLFPRDCPRIVMWPTAATTEADRHRWFAGSQAEVVAYVEWDWLERLRTAELICYTLPSETFEDLKDAGMWVSRHAVIPLERRRLADLPAALRAAGVELRVTETLTHLRPAWESSLHVSGVRLRHARGWA